MTQTSIPAGHPLAVKIFSGIAFARLLEAKNLVRTLTGEAPSPTETTAKLKGQTPPGMPIVRVTDLSKSAGDTVQVDAFDSINGLPLVGDRNAEGMGEALSSSTMDIRIDLLTKAIDAGGKMSKQRTLHNLRTIAMAQLEGYFPRLFDQMFMVHAAGARGSQVGKDWILPLQSNSAFSDILMNSVKAPTYNRHLVWDATDKLVQGGAQLANIASADTFSLAVIDELALYLDDMEFPLQPIKISDDKAADDDPIKAVMYVTPRQWAALQTDSNFRTALTNAWNRKSLGSQHPLFSGDPIMWRKILIRQLPRYTIRFLPSETTKHITSANKLTATETDVTVNGSLTAGYAVERALVMGAQAVGMAFGRNDQSNWFFGWHERKYNFERNLEIMGDTMFGLSKLRFKYANASGDQEPTDIGSLVLDTAVKL